MELILTLFKLDFKNTFGGDTSATYEDTILDPAF